METDDHLGPSLSPFMASQTYQPTVGTSTGPGTALYEAWPETRDLSREDLDALLRDEQYFDAWFGALPRVRAYNEALDGVLKNNEDITAANMAQKPRLDALRAETAAAFQAANDLKARWAQLDHEQTQLYRRFAPEQQLARLRHATSDQDRLSESIAAEFQKGTLDDDAALARYREMRRVWHRRALTSELWTRDRVRW